MSDHFDPFTPVDIPNRDYTEPREAELARAHRLPTHRLRELLEELVSARVEKWGFAFIAILSATTTVFAIANVFRYGWLSSLVVAVIASVASVATTRMLFVTKRATLRYKRDNPTAEHWTIGVLAEVLDLRELGSEKKTKP